MEAIRLSTFGTLETEIDDKARPHEKCERIKKFVNLLRMFQLLLRPHYITDLTMVYAVYGCEVHT